jgi:hypothetical protein
MTLRPEYSLGHSQYNNFLFADVGAETGGEELTVLSALVRLDIDPWHEAARLSDLPRDVAASSLARTLARLPDANWKVADSDANVARLVAILPTGSTPEIPSTVEAARARGGASRSAAGVVPKLKEAMPSLRSWLFWAGLVVAAFLFFQLLQPDNNLEPPNRSTTEQR